MRELDGENLHIFITQLDISGAFGKVLFQRQEIVPVKTRLCTFAHCHRYTNRRKCPQAKAG
jgi:hypothetical protein